MYEYVVAGKGLRTMFWGEIAVLASLPVLLVFPLLGLIGILVSGIVALEGLNKAGYAHDNYHAAMALLILGIVLIAVGSVAGDSPVADALGIIDSFLFSLSTYYICGTIGTFLSARGEEEVARWAKRLWKLTVGCHMADVVCALLPWPDSMVPLAGLLSIALLILSLAAVFMRIVLYYKTYKLLLT